MKTILTIGVSAVITCLLLAPLTTMLVIGLSSICVVLHGRKEAVNV